MKSTYSISDAQSQLPGLVREAEESGSVTISRHGEAVALGMLGAARLADLHYGDGLDRVAAHREMLDAYGLPKAIDTAAFDGNPEELQRDIFNNLFKDKKRNASGLRFVLVPELGRAEVVSRVDEALVRDAIASLF